MEASKITGGRKFWLSLLVVVAATALCGFGKLDGAPLANVLITTVLAFSGANAGEHVAKAWGQRG